LIEEPQTAETARRGLDGDAVGIDDQPHSWTFEDDLVDMTAHEVWLVGNVIVHQHFDVFRPHEGQHLVPNSQVSGIQTAEQQTAGANVDETRLTRRAPYEARADAIMYRHLLAEVARTRGWEVHCYDAKHVERQAADVLGERADDVLRGPRAALGPPWTRDHRVALAATVVADSRQPAGERRNPRE
jgi:hypothetical protein